MRFNYPVSTTTETQRNNKLCGVCRCANRLCLFLFFLLLSATVPWCHWIGGKLSTSTTVTTTLLLQQRSMASRTLGESTRVMKPWTTFRGTGIRTDRSWQASRARWSSVRTSMCQAPYQVTREQTHCPIPPSAWCERKSPLHFIYVCVLTPRWREFFFLGCCSRRLAWQTPVTVLDTTAGEEPGSDLEGHRVHPLGGVGGDLAGQL